MIEKILVISTGHLPKAEIDLLNARIVGEEYNGWVRPEGTMCCLTVSNLDLSDLPCLSELLSVTARHKCEWLMLDRDGEELSTHPTFSW